MISIKEKENEAAKQQLETVCKLNFAYEPRVLVDDIDKEMSIHEKGLTIILSSEVNQEKQRKTEALLKERCEYIRHTPTGGLKGTCLFFNMKHIGLPPTPPNPLFGRLCIPGVSNYNGITSSKFSVLLDPSAIKYVPTPVLERIGNLSGKQVELFLIAVDKSSIYGGHSILLHTHRWAYPNLLPGDDQKCDVQMGIFPEVGIQQSMEMSAIAFNDIRPMQVHVHPDETSQRNHQTKNISYKSEDMLDSPNNAHFDIIEGSPFGVMWAVAQKDNRIAITKMIVFVDREHPICQAYAESIRECYCLKTHLDRLEKVKDRIQETFANAIALFEKNDRQAMNVFNKLPSAFQYGIFKEAWKEFESPIGIHRDFGKASFLCENSLDAKYHCDSNKRAKILRSYVNELQNLLVNSQNDLMLNSQALIKADNTLKLMRCAQDFLQKKEEEAIFAFNNFSKEEKQAVYHAIWELSGCPRGNDDFGGKTFIDLKTKVQLKVEALILAASRLTPSGYENKLPQKNNNIDNRIQILDVEPLKEDALHNVLLVEDNNAFIPAPSLSRAQIIVNQAISLIGEEGFIQLDNIDRANKVNLLLSTLPQETRNEIYGSVYHHSSVNPKGGNDWGMHHVADDLNALMNALMDVLDG